MCLSQQCILFEYITFLATSEPTKVLLGKEIKPKVERQIKARLRSKDKSERNNEVRYVRKQSQLLP